MRKKKFKERTPIEVIVKVETLKNGYSLDVDGKEYLYFEQDYPKTTVYNFLNITKTVFKLDRGK